MEKIAARRRATFVIPSIIFLALKSAVLSIISAVEKFMKSTAEDDIIAIPPALLAEIKAGWQAKTSAMPRT
jgi:hypothetical protein